MFVVNWILAGVLVALSSSVQAISEISIKGAKFFNAQGEQVFFKGNSSSSSMDND
jgi:hypothetical protein